MLFLQQIKGKTATTTNNRDLVYVSFPALCCVYSEVNALSLLPQVELTTEYSSSCIQGNNFENTKAID